MTKRQRLIFVGQIVVLCTAVVGAVLTSRASDWQPIELVFLLLFLTIGSELAIMDWRGLRISTSFLALALAMALLGPAPAAAIGVAATFVDIVLSPRRWDKAFNNITVFATFPLVGGLLVDWAVGRSVLAEEDALRFAVVVLCVFLATNFLNFAMVAGYHTLLGEIRFWDTVRSLYLAVLPVEVAMALLTGAIAFSYYRLGVSVFVLLAVVLLVFQYLLRAGIQAYERGEELQKRTRQLASLQVGLLSTVLQTLSMRDAMTARHSAAVARYSREVARMLGMSQEEQELVHTAGLLHDIGKFIFPDSILFADRRLTEEEWEIVKLHPEQGAKLVRRIEGYGPVADIVLAHHERFDGKGYPYGIAAEDIPLASRILAAADTYDVMTSRDSYRQPVSSEEALEELRSVAGAQLDPAVVTAFTTMIEEHQVAFRHTDATDFERELGFDRRVEDYARPRPVAA